MLSVWHSTKRFVCVVSVLFVLVSYARDADAAGDAAKGKPIYVKHCMVCHGPQGLLSPADLADVLAYVMTLRQ